jgi:hypothetical protein
MKERPILFSTPMVSAILEGRKTQTRRILKNPEVSMQNCPYGKPGDLLWVRETWGIEKRKEKRIVFKARMNDYPIQDDRWRPSIHMPKDAARIWLKLTEVRVERLQDITEKDAIAEGIEDESPYFYNPKYSFISLWESINGEGSFYQNPWVWVLTFEVLSIRK